ncbi:DUF2589 domain-containing protein [Stenotrophomonas maltophilia]|jgi:hypothetical protein|uniref:DUF2589 domain-containing protein n=1 Tax=Stenotrophomonas TaxID=40323 RepID=UPI0006C04593|nr:MULTISPECIES: DUF2589 domain-containing protein [Stenotrophomonas]KAA3601962.1 DUF2589 domain-containing protein [Stenotrophomonas maltophilia]HCT28941.1 DUF2589 domain-containing protein [Stenotrophomonas sp.]KOO80894.1 hypothetical protein VO93_21145 [Stenotrophomonas maltophilia]MBN5125957.1 DUF2589 domain-containing protein [Stenotrophomonas maltophilia]MBN5176277.1 DUF2589 domain-containing protein [Stenotrophomonas maltophilia]
MSELVNISSQFKGLPMSDLIGGPLTAACDSQIKLAQATASFIRSVGFLPPDPANADPNAVGATRTALFRFKRPVDNLDPATKAAQPFAEEEVELEVPLLAIVKVPNLSIQKVDINFEMEVKSSFSAKESSDYSASLQAEMKVGWGIFSAKVNIQGSVASHKENARSSDNSAKYTVSVLAEDTGMPEGLARVMDILQTATAPRKVSAPVPVAA